MDIQKMPPPPKKKKWNLKLWPKFEDSPVRHTTDEMQGSFHILEMIQKIT